MSLAIHTNDVVAVLLVDGWHVVWGHSFDLDNFEYYLDPDTREYVDTLKRPFNIIRPEGVTAGAVWMETAEQEICCPIQSILAVKLRRRRLKD